MRYAWHRQARLAVGLLFILVVGAGCRGGNDNDSGSSPWPLIAGFGIGDAWDVSGPGANQVRSFTLYRDKVYAAVVSEINRNAEVWEYDGTGWQRVGGGSTRGSWASGSKCGVYSLAADATYLYAGLGDMSGDAEVWRFDGATWAQVGGDGLLSSWPESTHDAVWSLGFHQGQLYAGLMTERAGINKALLYRFDGSGWSLMTGDNGELGGWRSADGYITTYVLVSDGTMLYVGLAGRSSGTAEVWRYDGSVFTQVGGDGLNQSWSVKYVEDLIVYNGKVYASVQRLDGTNPSQSSVWEYNGATWRAAGTSIPAESADLTIFNKFLPYRGKLYISAGGKNRTVSVWELQSDETWVGIGPYPWRASIHAGDSGVHPLWICSMIDYRGAMLVGLASSAVSGRGQVWEYQ